jgi:predicted AAA+ superfamily ATPase
VSTDFPIFLICSEKIFEFRSFSSIFSRILIFVFSFLGVVFMSINTIRIALKGISAYQNICRKPLMEQVSALLDAIAAGRGEDAAQRYAQVFYQLRQEDCAGLGDWLEERLRYEEAPYPLLVERGGSDPALESAARRDVETFALLAGLDCDKLIAAIQALLPDEYQPMLSNLPRWKPGAPFDFDGLTEFYRAHGAGVFARYRAFLWERGELVPVAQPDVPDRRELLGYDLQRQAVVANTRALLEGRAVNNALLYGDSGTGKSATVKSLLAVEGFDDLRLIELPKDALTELPVLIRRLRGRRQKFILFIDDLAFDQDDRTYSLMKTILEGGLEPRPDNVAIYATSNRRNLVRQTFSDRAGDEVDAFETIQEKTALADRFGLRVAYLPLNKPEFLNLVEKLAQWEGVSLNREDLRSRAVQWEMHHPGRTPRTARQFIASLKL